MSTITTPYPSLETVMNLVRVYLNDWQPGATSTPGEGQITTDNPSLSPQTLPALNSAIREVYRELRNIGAPSLIRDNVQIALPANAANGPNIQTYLSFNGYYDGVTLNPSPVLPADFMYPEYLWEQQTGSGLPFVPMTQPEAGLPSPFEQGFVLGMWEWRGGATVTAGTGGSDALFFIGALCPITIRLRYRAALTQFVTPVAFATTYIPIMDCEEAVAAKTAFKIARALSGMVPSVTDLKQDAVDAMNALKLAYVRRAQTIEYSREPYDLGTGAGSNFSGYNNTF